MSTDTTLAPLRTEADQWLKQPLLAEVMAACHPFASTQALDLSVHPQCPMLAHSLRAHGHAGRAVSQYFAVAIQQATCVAQLLDQWPLSPGAKCLDFACGHGRLQRFLEGVWPARRRYVCDVQQDAVADLQARYGVQALPSSLDPAALPDSEAFDLIWVASLFSHLPSALFDGWLKTLVSRLSAGGVMAFSVHDATLLPADWVMPEEGLLYQAGSENAQLDAAHYGTTFVSEARVAAALAKAGVRHWQRYPRLLAHEQDLYLVSHQPQPWPTLRLGPRGWLDRIEACGPGRWRLHGWAGSPEDGVLAKLSWWRAEGRQTLVADQASAAVAEVLQQPRLSAVGLCAEVRGEAGECVALVAEDSRGLRSPVYVGPLVADAH